MSTDQIARITKAGLDRMERELEQDSPPPPPPQEDTVHAHVERTVHAILDAIHGELPHVDELTGCDRVKQLAEAVHALCAVAYPTSEGGPR